MKDSESDLAARLETSRRHLGLSQATVAAAAGVSAPTQSAYESGNRTPSIRYLLRLSRLGFDLGYLLFGKPSAVVASEWLDWDLLEEVRDGVDEWCRVKNVQFSDSKHRQIVRLLYEHFAATGKIEDAHLSELLRMVA